jgi:hypothetical protein
MKWRIATTVVLGLLLGTWAYLAEWSYERADSLHMTLQGAPVMLSLFLLTILGGFLVSRAWALLALLGPAASLAYLQSTGHRGPDGISPLTSPPGIFHLILYGMLLGLSIGLSSLWREFRDRRDLRST